MTFDKIQEIAREEMERVSDFVEIRDTERGDKGLFAKKQIRKGDLKLVYWGTILTDFADTAYAMQCQDPMYTVDGRNIRSFARYINHSDTNFNMHKLSHPIREFCPEFLNHNLCCDFFVRLIPRRTILKDEELLLNYGKEYDYNKYFKQYSRQRGVCSSRI